MKSGKFIKFISCIVLFSILGVGCNREALPESEQLPAETGTPAPTEAPMAARVNGEGILLVEFEAEMLRYQTGLSAAKVDEVPEDAEQIVLDFLVDRLLLAQGAYEQGFIFDESSLNSRMGEITADAGGEDALKQWIEENFYSEESFKKALVLDLAAVWMRNKIIADVPTTADQIHARQILVKNENEAVVVERQLQVGNDFTALAFQYDVLTGGDLGWFPSGYLLQPDVEKAAFALQPGQFSGIIPTSYGYHIVYVIERDPQRSLSPEALRFVQRIALEKWLSDKRQSSTIEKLIP